MWDPAVEHQLVARAYRMGATGSVHVAQLLMKGTLEEELHQINGGGGPPPAAPAAASGTGTGSSSRGPGTGSSSGAGESAAGGGAGSVLALNACGDCEATAPSTPGAPSQGSGRSGAGAESNGGGSGSGGSSDGHLPRTAPSSRAAGKRRMGDLDHLAEDMTPPTKRANLAAPDGGGTVEGKAVDGDAPRPAAPPPPQQSTAAQEEAKVHRLLKSIRFVREQSRALT